MRFNWIKEIEDYEQHLAACLKDYGDLALLNKILSEKNGAEAFIEVAENFNKTSIRFPERPIKELKKVYVYQNKRKPVAAMARKLDVDEATVYSWLREFGIRKDSGKHNNNFNMFEED